MACVPFLMSGSNCCAWQVNFDWQAAARQGPCSSTRHKANLSLLSSSRQGASSNQDKGSQVYSEPQADTWLPLQ